MKVERDIAEWKWSQWAGTLEQIHQSATLAQEKVRAATPYPEPYDAEHPWDSEREHEAKDQRARYESYLEADDVHKTEVVVEERNGYRHHAPSLDYLAHIPERTINQIERIAITVGRTYIAPGVDIRMSNDGLSIEVAGNERTWTAGLRHELENVLRPPWRLHPPLMTDISWLFPAIPTIFFLVFLGLDLLLSNNSPWSATTCALVSVGSSALLALAIGGLAWASTKKVELLQKGTLPRYQRWRKRAFAAVGAVLIGVIASALYGITS